VKPTIVKCARTVCRRTSATPKEDGWSWIEFDPEPPKTGWWCPACAEGVRKIMAAHDLDPTVERLH
jgi:hypothetical protein